jgi:hypothetical protein
VSAKGKWQDRGNGEVWMDHVAVKEADLDRLRSVQWLTAWNVKFPEGFLAQLPQLVWLDLRGGSRSNLELLDGCAGLRGLVVNQVTGLEDSSAIAALANLEILSLYGLARLTGLPPLDSLARLRRIHLGQLRSLQIWDPLADASALEELFFMNKLDPDEAVMTRLASHPSLQAFSWSAPDEPIGKVRRIVETVGKPPTTIERPETWLKRHF